MLTLRTLRSPKVNLNEKVDSKKLPLESSTNKSEESKTEEKVKPEEGAKPEGKTENSSVQENK